MNTNIDRREFLRRASYGAMGILGSTAMAQLPGCRRFGRESVEPPNIVLILADDMGYSDIGCYGGEMRTPHIDRLAGGGLRFTHFHNTARCCPTRACLLTGLYPHQAGVGDMMNDGGVDGYRGDLNRNCMTVAEVLKTAGYGTYAVGKWHVTRFMEPDGPKHNWPCQRGFDRYFGTITGAGSYFEPTTLTLDNDPAEAPTGRFYYTDGISEYAARFIREHRQKHPTRPFFVYTAFTAPHWPLHAWEEDIAHARGRFDPGWDRLRQARYERMRAMGIIDDRWKLTQRDSRVPPWEDAEHKAWQLRRMEVYAAQIEAMDRGIGRIVEELERQGILEQTLIFFLSDNGGCAEELNTQGWYDYILRGKDHIGREFTLDGRPVRVGNHPTIMPGPYDTYQSYGIPWANLSNTPFRLYKTHVHTGGVATPLVVHWPAGIEAMGEWRGQVGHLIDIMTTCVEVSGAVYPREHSGQPILPMEGRSLVPAFADKSLEREAVYFEHEHNRAVLAGGWKLVSRRSRDSWELYDMAADRTETRDLAAQDPDRVRRMASLWQDWAVRARVLPYPE
jgi:arylsulfatase